MIIKNTIPPKWLLDIYLKAQQLMPEFKQEDWKTLSVVGQGRLSGIYMKQYGYRFGNSIIEMAKAIHVARTYGFKHIYLSPDFLPNTKTLLPSLLYPDSHLYGDIKISTLKENSRKMALISGNFFFEDCNEPILGYIIVNELAPFYCNHSVRKNIADKYSASLIVHFRGGDIFCDNIHPWYVQPPLSYYQYCIRHYRQNNSHTTKIVLVSQDRKNPCVDALVKWLKLEGIPFSFSINTFNQDVRLISSADAVISSVGSFIPVLVSLSQSIQFIYVFRSPILENDLTSINFGDIFETYGKSIHIIEDKPNNYIHQGNWGNSEEQKRLMLTYSIQ